MGPFFIYQKLKEKRSSNKIKLKLDKYKIINTVKEVSKMSEREESKVVTVLPYHCPVHDVDTFIQFWSEGSRTCTHHQILRRDGKKDSLYNCTRRCKGKAFNQ